MRGKKMGMRAALTRLLGIATVACALVATPAVANAETQVPANTQVLSLGQAGKEPVKITEPGCYVLRTSENQTTPSSGYVIDVPNSTSYNPVTIYIDGTVYVNSYTNSSVGQNRWLFNIKQGSNIEFIGINNPCVSFHDQNGGSQSVSGFLTDRYYDGGYKNASGDISVSLKLGDGSQNFFLSYSSRVNQKVPAISLGSTEGELTAKFEKLKIQGYVGRSGAVAGNAQEYAVPAHLFREGRDTTGGNINPFTATFADCEFYDTSGDFNGAVSVDGNSSFKMPKDGSAVAKLTATFNNCSFSGSNGENLGVRQTNNSYESVEASRYFANSSILNTYAVAGVMGVTNATVNLNSCTMSNFHSTRSSSADNTLTVDALNVARSARCNINGGEISRYGARGNTCVVYAAGTLTLNGSPEIASYWKNSHADDTNYGDKYTEADKATGTAKSLYVPKKKSVDANVPALHIASDFSVRGGFGDNVWISIEETADSNGVKSRVLGTCESNEIEGVVPDGSSENDDNSDKYEIVNLKGDLTFRETIHQHKWNVEADGLGVRASCVGPFRNSECEYGKDENGEVKKYLTATYKLSMSKATSSQSTALVYDGCPVKIALNKDGAWNLEQMGVTASDEFTWYQCKSQADAEAYKNGTKLKDAPADAGYYYVVTSFKTASGQTLEGKKSFEISQRRLVKNQSYKFTLKDGGKGAGKYAYDGKEHQPVVESAKFKNGAGEWVDLVEGKDYELSARSESGLKQTEPGQYECIVIGKGNFTTDGGTTSVLTLKWEIVDVSRFDLEVTGFEGDYDGKDHSVDASALPEGAVVEYKAADGGWTSVAPSIKDAGSVTVDYRVTIDDAAVEGKVTLEVKPRAITVTALDAFKTYGENDPKFTYDVTSGELVEGESLQGIEIERDDDDSVRDGGYALRLTQPEGANSNYKITFKDGTFTISKRELAVTWDTTIEFTYDGEEHCPQAKLHNVVGDDDLSACVDGAKVKAGTYTAKITELTGDDAGNYKLPAEGLTCEFSIKKAPQGAPKVQATAETVSGKSDGKITGVDATMEWRAKGAAEYQAVGEGVAELKDLAAGVYEVRYQAKANYDASSATEVTVAAGPKLVVTLPSNQVGYALSSTATELDWHGTATLTMSIDSAYFAGKDYAVKVNGTSVKLSAKGTYELKDVEGDVNVTVEGILKHEPDGSGWAHDAKNHWHVCRCGEVLDKAEHTFEWVVDKPATTEAKGEWHQECTACGEKGKTEAILVPEIIDGKGQTMVADAAKDLSFRSSAPLRYFQKVLVDDKEVAAENYVLTEGSTIVTLKASFLNTLGVGEHTLSVVSTTGTAETTFTVAKAAKPAPGQTTTTTTTTTTTSKPKKRASKEALPESGDSTYVIAAAVLAAGVAVLLLAWAIMKRRA